MQHWWNIYKREKWNEEWKLVANFENGVLAREEAKKLSLNDQQAEYGYCSACGTYLHDTELEGRMKKMCADYNGFYANSGGFPPINSAILDWSIGFDADFVHRVK